MRSDDIPPEPVDTRRVLLSADRVGALAVLILAGAAAIVFAAVTSALVVSGLGTADSLRTVAGGVTLTLVAGAFAWRALRHLLRRANVKDDAA